MNISQPTATPAHERNPDDQQIPPTPAPALRDPERNKPVKRKSNDDIADVTKEKLVTIFQHF